MHRRLFATLAVGGVITLGVAGCSSEPENTAASTSSTATTKAPKGSTTTLARPASPETAEGLTEVATRYLEYGVQMKGPESFSELSDRCRTTWKTAEDWTANMNYAGALLVNLGFTAEGAVVESVTPGPIADGSADVVAVVKTADGKVIEPLSQSSWVYEDGGWRSDSCESAQP